MKVPILLPNIFNHPFTYESDQALETGDYVLVPFGKSKITGVVWDDFEKKNNKNFKIKKIIKKLEVPRLKKSTIKFLNWFSEYNIIPKGMALKLMLLSGNAIEKLSNSDLQKFEFIKKNNSFELSEEQKNSLKKMNEINEKFRVHVLQGTTGSGKTMVYFEALKDRIIKGFQGLILLPEIGLTGQFESKFIEFFGFQPAVWHSGITKKNKEIIWSGIVNGEIKVVIGARSSLFLPFKNLGLIIVDEEHDQSYKQDEGVTYNARDMAISRASFENIPINLITAVPSIETFENIKKGKYSSSKIEKRFKNASLPEYEIINLNKTKLDKQSWLSKEIIEKVKFHLNRKDQILFFLNRRGFSPHVLCNKCFNSYTCPNCSINLVYHKNKNNLLCHYCGFKGSLNRDCVKDGKCENIFSGPGVERISEEVKKNFPNKKIEIFSSDTMNKKDSSIKLEKIINNEIQILIGTQLISKGFHFPNLNCIVVVDIDLTSQGHDLRGAEKNLQLYHQLSGRAGRTGKPAVVYFQTYSNNPKMILDITNKNPEIFLEKELELRKMNKLPPFQRFISLILTGENEDKLEKEAFKFKDFLQGKIIGKILGPVSAPIFRLKKKYRVRFLIRGPKSMNMQNSVANIVPNYKFPSGIKLSVDVDPINFN
ncbi:MAG: primosomal protein N' [Pelagibacteraceae bacterium BACL5 MAG-120705-bin12]|jgi:primosomal protein N' (replication factor Y) (superfamily II helicase)|uniref:replication restart helicase PriA n=1 Tax=Candidatus Pelagibacter sp. TaxID=2024849 RepID=UPI00071453C5|nr:MAG: primosomal protein N' [Pelagibacteraceae bacterium BACL5 MAG-121015-bin10]KRO61499.1 MAG: primosomal protein N' [Pelagibacteraceae bacterium BACL5 MAG-120705-bin12]KRO65484.1 MAG: primosomal protein N' [Pelagibacteraceae bacterium BACL5 MAG-120820-bin39]MDA1166721.1 primosomal protein N' [Pseudomonadota bacterium]